MDIMKKKQEMDEKLTTSIVSIFDGFEKETGLYPTHLELERTDITVHGDKIQKFLINAKTTITIY